MYMCCIGTAVLQIGSARNPPWYLQYCNGGVYTCVVNSPGGAVHERNFTLLIGCKLVTTCNLYVLNVTAHEKTDHSPQIR